MRQAPEKRRARRYVECGSHAAAVVSSQDMYLLSRKHVLVLTLPWGALEGRRQIAWGFSPRTADANHMAP